MKKIQDRNYTDYQKAFIRAVKKALKTGKVWATVHNVARSGMSRTISCYIIHKGEICPINWIIRDHCPVTEMKDGTLRVYGCGMNMIVWALDSLAHALKVDWSHQRYGRI